MDCAMSDSGFSEVTVASPLLLSSFNQQADNLSQLLGSCGKLQLHLSRPAVTNSLPCPAPLQAPLVALTKSLGEVTIHAEASLAALQWVGNQAWEDVGERTNQSASLLDKAAQGFEQRLSPCRVSGTL